MKFRAQTPKFKVLLLFAICYLLFAILCGCEAFRKKFVRKPKGEKEIEVVVRTQEYESKYSLEETYKKYFLFWQSWHDELINALDIQDGNRKRLLFCAKKVIENLQQMQRLLQPDKQTELDIFILEQKNIIRQIERYKLSNAQELQIRRALEKQKRKIQKEFAYKSVQEYLVKE